MGPSDPHVSVVIYYSNKGSKFFSILRFSDLQNRFDLVIHWFYSSAGNPVTQIFQLRTCEE